MCFPSAASKLRSEVCIFNKLCNHACLVRCGYLTKSYASSTWVSNTQTGLAVNWLLFLQGVDFSLWSHCFGHVSCKHAVLCTVLFSLFVLHVVQISAKRSASGAECGYGNTYPHLAARFKVEMLLSWLHKYLEGLSFVFPIH